MAVDRDSRYLRQMASDLTIVPGDLDDPRIIDLLTFHLAQAHANSPVCGVHALNLPGLKAPEVSFWAGWTGETLTVIGALKVLSPDHGEVKSMRTAEGLKGRGAGGAMLDHIIAAARARGLRRLSLETGSNEAFAPARAMYAGRGFTECGPFEGYRLNDFSRFMTMAL